MTENHKTSLSAGLIVRALLTESTDVGAITRRVFPVRVDEARLPYIAYRRSAMETMATKSGSADVLTFEVLCYADSYAGSVALAEAVRTALDGVQTERDGLVLRSCLLADAEDMADDDAFVQVLTFTARV